MRSNARAERGITLMVVMILLVVVTVIGIAAARIALLGERSTRFDRDYQIAWEGAEAALVDAEFDIDGPNTSSANRLTTFTPYSTSSGANFIAGGCGTTDPFRGLCGPTPPVTTPVWQLIDFVTESTSSRPFVIFGEKTGRGTFQSGNGIQPAQAPHYIIEQVADVRAGHDANAVVYRVTSIGFGPNLQTQVLMQSIYAKE